jgi:hypothetical protein
MGILLAFAPFIVYVIIERLAGITAGLVAATLTSVALLIRDGISRQRKVKILEIGTALLFGGLAAYSDALPPEFANTLGDHCHHCGNLGAAKFTSWYPGRKRRAS